MSSAPTVVVRKGGVFTALVSGVFGTLIVCIICGSALGWYALNIADRKVSDVFGAGQAVFAALPEWRESLPVLADLLNDRRAPEYREQLEVAVRVEPARRGRRDARAVVEVTNAGSKTITLLTARIVLVDEDGVPCHEYSTFIATPFTVDEEDWRGPLLAGSTRRLAQRVGCVDESLSASIEITDLRVWTGQAPPKDVPAETPVEPVE